MDGDRNAPVVVAIVVAVLAVAGVGWFVLGSSSSKPAPTVTNAGGVTTTERVVVVASTVPSGPTVRVYMAPTGVPAGASDLRSSPRVRSWRCRSPQGWCRTAR